MLRRFSGRKRLVYLSLVLWGAGSIVSVASGWAQLFGALGSFALCISFAVFLTERCATQEQRRLWDSQILTQSRMVWRYMMAREKGDKSGDPTPPHKLRDQITSNFDELLAAKAEEKDMETYHAELFFSITGTLQWGFGELLLNSINL